MQQRAQGRDEGLTPRPDPISSQGATGQLPPGAGSRKASLPPLGPQRLHGLGDLPNVWVM